MKTPSVRSGLLAVWVVAAGCAANTRYRGVSIDQLSDEQLVQELESAVRGLGLAVSREMYLMAIRPEPAYVLTSSTTTFAGSMTATYNTYSMPVGYGIATHGTSTGTVRGTGQTRYQYTDVNAGARLGNAIALAVSRSRQASFRRRAQEVWSAFQNRVALRRAQTERLISNFFAANPSLQQRRMLVAAIAPWVAAEGASSDSDILEGTRRIVESLPRGVGLSGRWYGMIAQTTRLESGETVAFSEFVRIDLTDDAGRITGRGVLGTGELLELTGRLDQQRLSATVANTTSAINVTLTGVVASTQITGDYAGGGAGQRLSGTFALLR